MLLRVSGGRLVEVRGDPDNPFNRGSLCPRGLAAPALVYSSKRILHPMVRTGRRGSGSWRRVSWPRALRRATAGLAEARDRYGPESVVFCKGTGRDIGPWLSRLAWGFGSPNYFALGPGSGSACLMPRMTAATAMMGRHFVADCSQYHPLRYGDPRWRRPDCILVWGCNPVISNPDGFLGQWIVRCMELGSRLVVVDPRRTWLAARADFWLRLLPGTDCQLAMCFLGTLFRRGLADREFLSRWCSGTGVIREQVRSWTPKRAAGACGLDADDIRRAVDVYGSGTSALQWGLGVDMSRSATGTAFALAGLVAASGNLEVPGGNLLATDPFGMPRRGPDVPGGSELRARRIGIERYPLLGCGVPYAQADILLDQMESGAPYSINAAWIQGTNTFVSSFADPRRVAEAFSGLDTVVVCDLFMTPTAHLLGDVFLPVATYPERYGLRNWWYQLAAVRRAIDPLGEARSDQEILLQTGRRLAPETFPWDSVEEWFDAMLKPSGMDFAELLGRGWSMPGIQYGRHEKGLLRRDGRPGFETPSGLVELAPSAARKAGLPAVPYLDGRFCGTGESKPGGCEYPLTLTTGARVPWFFHSEHRMVKALRQRNPAPLVQMSPADAAEGGVSDGDWVRLRSPWGTCLRSVSVTDAVARGVLSAQHAWWLPERDDPADEVFWSLNVNALLPSGQQGRSGLGYPFRCIPCAVEAFEGDTSQLPNGSGPPVPPLLEPSDGYETPNGESILVDPWLCTGCGSCEIACLAAHRREEGVLGVRVLPIPERPGEHVPRITAACDLCASTDAGEPSCVAHCPSKCLLLPGHPLPERRVLRYVPEARR